LPHVSTFDDVFDLILPEQKISDAAEIEHFNPQSANTSVLIEE